VADVARDLSPYLLHRDIEGLEHARRDSLPLAEQPEQDVLGADVVVLESPRLFLRELLRRQPRALGEPLEHSSGG
jgi:hypothetical protein